MDDPSPDPVLWRVPPELLARDRLRPLYRRSDGRGLTRLAGHGALIAVAATAVHGTAGTLWLGPSLLAYGAVLTALFAPLHECVHRTAFARRRLNDAIAWLCGLVLMLPPFYFRRFHFDHHRYTQDPAGDPELSAAKPATRAQYLWQASGLPYWADRLATTLGHAGGRVRPAGFLPLPVHGRVIREARLLWAVYLGLGAASLAAGSTVAVWYWLVPAVLGQPLLRLFLMAEHGGCPRLADGRVNTRTTPSNAVVRFLAWNMPYHAEHHLYPAVPFHQLPRLHALVADKLAITAPGYVAVHRLFLARLAAGHGL
jgi:fatty acid desaturase